jgi:hypothetical protein
VAVVLCDITQSSTSATLVKGDAIGRYLHPVSTVPEVAPVVRASCPPVWNSPSSLTLAAL